MQPNPTSKEFSPGFISVVRAEQYWVDQSRKNIAQFMNYISDGAEIPARHHLEWLYAILDPKVKRLLIIAPRESAKTTLIVKTMAWWMGHFPHLTNIISSVSSDQTADRLEMLRDLIALPRYQNVFPHIHIDESKSRTKSEFTIWSEKWPGSEKTLSYGVYRSLIAKYGSLKNPTVHASGITSSKIIGRRFSGIALVDDPHDSKNSATEDQRTKVEKMFAENILGGVQHNAKVVVITTRWAETDLAGRLKDLKTANGDYVWKTIDIPCLDEDNNSYWPEYWTLEKLQEKREEVGEIMFQTMYMNNPIGASSGMFQQHHLVNDIPSEHPAFARIAIGVDMAKAKTANADFTAAFAVARDDKKPFNYYILNGIRGKWDFDEALTKIADFSQDIFDQYGRLDAVVFESPNDISSAQHLHEDHPDLPVIEQPTKGDKAIRLGFVAVKAQSGKLFINQNMLCFNALKSELLGFPKAAHDDTCDALSLPLQLTDWSSGVGAGVKTLKSPYLL